MLSQKKNRLILLSVELEELIIPGMENKMEKLNIRFYPYPLDHVEVTDWGINKDLTSVSFVLQAYREEFTMIFNEHMSWKVALKLEFDLLFVKPLDPR